MGKKIIPFLSRYPAWIGVVTTKGIPIVFLIGVISFLYFYKVEIKRKRKRLLKQPTIVNSFWS